MISIWPSALNLSAALSNSLVKFFLTADSFSSQTFILGTKGCLSSLRGFIFASETTMRCWYTTSSLGITFISFTSSLPSFLTSIYSLCVLLVPKLKWLVFYLSLKTRHCKLPCLMLPQFLVFLTPHLYPPWTTSYSFTYFPLCLLRSLPIITISFS